MSVLSKLRSLRAIEMAHLAIPGSDIAFIEPLERLEKLSLHNVVLRGHCLSHLARSHCRQILASAVTMALKSACASRRLDSYDGVPY